MANVLVSGGTGFIGSRVCTALHEQGDTVHVLSRNPTRAQTQLKSVRAVYGWNPETEKLPSEATSDVKAVVHLAGETIAGRWNAEKKTADTGEPNSLDPKPRCVVCRAVSKTGCTCLCLRNRILWG